MRFVSPIKNGEYWANGLPIFMPYGIGDDSRIIEENALLGKTFELKTDSIKESIKDLVEHLPSRKKVSELASLYRSPDQDKKVYNSILS
jgi:hypothetical protein